MKIILAIIEINNDLQNCALYIQKNADRRNIQLDKKRKNLKKKNQDSMCTYEQFAML